MPRVLPGVRPVADPANVILGRDHRITVLDAGLVRLEFSASGVFEDRASQAVIDRRFEAADFELTESAHGLEIVTERLHLHYDRGPFSREGLSVRAQGGFHSTKGMWRYGEQTANLGGTARTLDEVDGRCPLEPGVLSSDGITVFDDSHSAVLDDAGRIGARLPDTVDLYVFAYGRDYRAALRALYRLTGPQPLLPRFALGNWWSRYHPYSAAEYLALLDRFAAAGVPLSVAVLDMDWHLVDVDPRYGSGWTGYTWNPDLFPDPPAFLAELHRRGLRVTLNVHPAEGVHAHEHAYPAVARRMGIDPATETPIAFDPTDDAFVDAYFEELHHPLEREGVDFWWIDWQQGGVSAVPGLDPLWLLNHYHYLDAGRDGRRPLTFSRYAGVGSHRYPIGFSGDTITTWASLDFQPYFTATASNIGYGWWSHDIGGHFFGVKDDDMLRRWVQLGVFSPILRLHSSLGAFYTKEPWRFTAETERSMIEALRFRHRLLPYLYAMNRRAHEDGEPLVQPVYYEHPHRPQAYECPNEYLFGDQLLIAPITTPADPVTTLGATTAWLPPGGWVDVFTGLAYHGDRTLRLHRDAHSIPVLARSGAILVLLAQDAPLTQEAVPGALEVRVYAGADGEFTLAEDLDDGDWALTRITVDAAAGTVQVHPATGNLAILPPTRALDVVCCGYTRIDEVRRDGAPCAVTPGPVPHSVRGVCCRFG